MVIGHTIGDRSDLFFKLICVHDSRFSKGYRNKKKCFREHILEKKRDKDGNVRNQQRFRNLDQGENR